MKLINDVIFWRKIEMKINKSLKKTTFETVGLHSSARTLNVFVFLRNF